MYTSDLRVFIDNFLFKIPFERHVTLPFLTTGRCEPISASTHPQWLSVCLNSFAEEFVSFRKIFRIKSTMLNQIHAWLWWNLGLGRAYDTYDTCKSSFYKKWDHCKCSLNMKYFFQLVSYNSVNSMKTKSRNNIFLKSRFMQNQKSLINYHSCPRYSNVSTAWKVFKYGVFPGPYFPELGLNTEIYGSRKYGPEKTPYSNTFLAVEIWLFIKHWATL